MKFGQFPVAEAAGAILAHSRKAGARTLKKGRVLSAADAADLAAAGVAEVIAARLDPDDVPEDEAARRIAERVAGPGLSASAPFTGRVNLFAEEPGLAHVDAGRLDAVNLIDEAITVATLPPFTPVEAGQMVATIKIIPFAAPGAALAAVLAAAGTDLVRLAPYRPLAAILIQTRLPGMKESILDKTVGVTRQRLSSVGGRLAGNGGPRTRPRPSPKRSPAPATRVPTSSSSPGRRPSSTGATCCRPASRRRAAWSSISGCRSIPATCCCSPGSATSRCWACPAAPGRPS
jgi:molybdopterin biosynthesis enzyme